MPGGREADPGWQGHRTRDDPAGAGPNWKVADIIPQPTPLLSGELREALAPLTAAYALEDEPR
jgi:hypothetical protein